MGQILHANARTTEAIRREIRNSEESIAKAAIRFNVNPKTSSNGGTEKIQKIFLWVLKT